MKKKSLNSDRLELADPPSTALTAPAEDALRRIGRHWKLIIAIAAVATLIAWMFAALQPKRYRASAIAAVTPNVNTLAVSEVLRGVDTLERRTLVATIAALASTPLTRRQTIGSEEGDGYTIEAVVMPNTNLLRVNVEGADPKRVATIANKVPDVIGAQTTAMYKFYRVTMASEAGVPHVAAYPRVGRTVAAGLLVGLALGAIVAYSIDRRRPATVR